MRDDWMDRFPKSCIRLNRRRRDANSDTGVVVVVEADCLLSWRQFQQLEHRTKPEQILRRRRRRRSIGESERKLLYRS